LGRRKELDEGLTVKKEKITVVESAHGRRFLAVRERGKEERPLGRLQRLRRKGKTAPIRKKRWKEIHTLQKKKNRRRKIGET